MGTWWSTVQLALSLPLDALYTMRKYAERQMVECVAPHRKYPERACGGNLFRVGPLTHVMVQIEPDIQQPGAIYHKCRYCHTVLEMRISTEAA